MKDFIFSKKTLVLKTFMEEKFVVKWKLSKRFVLVVTVTGAWRWRSILRRSHWSCCEPLRTEVGVFAKLRKNLSWLSLGYLTSGDKPALTWICWIMNGSSLWGWSQVETVLRTSPTFAPTSLHKACSPAARGLTIHFNSDSIHVIVFGCRYDSQLILFRFE